MLRWVLSALLLCLATAVVEAGGDKTLKLPDSGQVRVGGKAPGVASWDLENQLVTLASLLRQEGTRAVLLSFYASWCKECPAGLKALESGKERLAQAGVRVLLVNSGEPRETVSAFHRNLGLSLRVILDEFKQISKSYGVSGLPRSFLVGKDGNVRAIYIREGEDFVEQILMDAGGTYNERVNSSKPLEEVR
jgi:peroxiredoxin